MPSQNGYDPLHSSDTSTTDGSNDLQTRRQRAPVASFHIQSNGIDHDMCHVALQQQEGDQEDDGKDEERKEEESVR